MANADLTVSRLKEMLSYDPLSGLFTRIVSVNGPFGRVGFVCGSPDKKGHIYITLDGRRYGAHRLAWFYVNASWPLDQIDHINGARADNRIANLREANSFVNNQNRRQATTRSKLGILGVSQIGSKFSAMICLQGKNVRLGMFKTAEDAHAAYLDAKRRLHVGCQI